jgi:hypothetical protein
VQSIEQYSNDPLDQSFFDNDILELLKTNQISAVIKPFIEMKSDCGTEFVNEDMQQLLGNFGVFHSTTSPYSPHQNGIAERSNRTVFDLAAAVMHACGIAIRYWTHAVAFVIHTLNHLPCKALNLISTPHIEVFQQVPDVSYFRTFGCDAYMVLPDNKRPSFGLRAVKGIFLGYCHPHSLSYKILYRGHIYETGHVYFNEDLSTLQPPDNALIDNIKSFFSHIDDTASYQLTDQDIQGFADGRDSNDKTISAADDPSSRRIQDIIIDTPATPVAQRTRRQRALTAKAIRKKFNSNSTLFGLNITSVEHALLSNSHYFNDLCEVVPLSYEEHSLLANIVPLSYAFISLDTISVEEAMTSSEWPQWEKAMKDELDKLSAFNTWDSVSELPPGRKALLYKWVLKKKYDIYNKLIFKARLTVKGCSQRAGIDFNDTFSPVAKLTAVRLILSLGVIENFIFRQLDVQNAFPNATLSDVDIYMLAPKEMNSEHIYLKLNRALYGLKQASREWNLLITSTLKELGFKQLTS